MTIELLTREDYLDLLFIFKNYPNLTYQNTGYDYPDKSKWSEEDKFMHSYASCILDGCIQGFREFNHFKLRESGDVAIRVQYKYGPRFTGVGYLQLYELYFGFDLDDDDVLDAYGHYIGQGDKVIPVGTSLDNVEVLTLKGSKYSREEGCKYIVLD